MGSPMARNEEATTIEVTRDTHKAGIAWKDRLARKIGVPYLTWEQAFQYAFNSKVFDKYQNCSRRDAHRAGVLPCAECGWYA